MKIYIEKTGKTVSKKFSGNVAGLLKKMKINPEAVIVVKNDEVVTDDEKISDPDRIKILSVVSGG